MDRNEWGRGAWLLYRAPAETSQVFVVQHKAGFYPERLSLRGAADRSQAHDVMTISAAESRFHLQPGLSEHYEQWV